MLGDKPRDVEKILGKWGTEVKWMKKVLDKRKKTGI